VNGKWPRPSQITLLEEAKRFTYRGSANANAHDCIVLTIPEQASGTAVREFWVGSQTPYLIFHARARDGDLVFWQIDVEYRKQDSEYVPRSWTYTEYNHPGQLFQRHTFVVDTFEFNQPLQRGIFEQPMQPGMIVRDAEQDKYLEVDAFGNLVPLGQAGPVPVWAFLSLGGFALLSLIVACYYLTRRRLRRLSG
jgi:hypothetical protein